MSKNRNSRPVTPAAVTPDDATPADATPDDVTPDDATPDDATPDDATPDDATPAAPAAPALSVPKTSRVLMSQEQREAWFTYHPPSDETRPKYLRIIDAENAVAMCIDRDLANVEFDELNARYLAFADAINEVCPVCADGTAALRSLRLSRNAANEAKLSPPGGKRLLSLMALELLCTARWQANSAIACDGV